MFLTAQAYSKGGMSGQGKQLLESNNLNTTNQRVVNLFGHPRIYQQFKEVECNAYSQLQQLIDMFQAKFANCRVTNVIGL